MRRVLVGLLLAFALSGCAGPPSARPHAASAKDAVEAAPGRVAVLVQSTLGLPLAGVDLVLEPIDLAASTDDRGRFTFEGVAAAEYRLRASHLGYQGHVHVLHVEPGSFTEVTIVMAVLPVGPSSTRETTIERGFIQCSANALYSVDPCDGAVGASQDRFGLTIDRARDPKEVLVELVWTPTTPATAQQLQLDLCAPGGDLHCADAALGGDFHRSASGPSPLVLSLSAADVPGGTTALELWVGNGRLSPYPTVAQPFMLYVTLCYGAPCPDGFKARPA
jgi:carboxypeptidase family protein